MMMLASTLSGLEAFAPARKLRSAGLFRPTETSAAVVITEPSGNRIPSVVDTSIPAERLSRTSMSPPSPTVRISGRLSKSSATLKSDSSPWESTRKPIA